MLKFVEKDFTFLESTESCATTLLICYDNLIELLIKLVCLFMMICIVDHFVMLLCSFVFMLVVNLYSY